MSLNVAIVGFGNLGRAVKENIVKEKEFNLVGVFSRRNIEGTIPFSQILDFKSKIDLLFICSGSQSDLEKQAVTLIKDFNIIDSYDNHNRLKSHISKMDKIALEHDKIAICSMGWDPGLFSLMRGLFDAIGFTPYSFWGKGTSQGHTQALKQIEGVADALQFTLPNEKIIKKIKRGSSPVVNGKNFHLRECYVCSPLEKREEIKSKIITMPDYFEGYKTFVHFVSPKKLNSLKSFSHKGQVITSNNIMNFSLNLPSNPDFTAKILIAYARSFIHLKKEGRRGAFTIFDIPIKQIIKKDKFSYL